MENFEERDDEGDERIKKIVVGFEIFKYFGSTSLPATQGWHRSRFIDLNNLTQNSE